MSQRIYEFFDIIFWGPISQFLFFFQIVLFLRAMIIFFSYSFVHDLSLGGMLADVSFSCVVKHKDDGQTKFINPNSQRQDRIIKYWLSIGSIHKEQG